LIVDNRHPPARFASLVLMIAMLACNALQPSTPKATAPPVVESPTETSVPPPATPTAEPAVEVGSRSDSPIAYSLFLAGHGIFIHTVDQHGRNDKRLVDKTCLGALPKWSQDGSMLAYYCYDAQQERADLWVMNSDGSDDRFVAEMPDLLPLKWSPDNRFVVYHAPQPDGTENDIYVLDIESGEITDLTKDSFVWDAFPDWSPKGDLIVFTSDRAEQGKALDDIWIMKPDGSGLVNLTNNGTDWEDYHPAWSPDGESIAFFRSSSLFEEADEGKPPGLWVMDADGANQRLVLALDILRASGPPVWSPDGEYLAYAFNLGEDGEVWVVSSAGGDPVNLSKIPGTKSHISWSPDSKALIFTNDTDDTLEIYLALPDGSDTHALFEQGRYGYGDWSP
jgi:Tol biopolymer transport system component